MWREMEFFTQKTLDDIEAGKMLAVLFEGHADPAEIPDLVRLKPAAGRFSRDEVRALVRKDRLPFFIKVREMQHTSIFSLTDDEVSSLGCGSRDEVLEDARTELPHLKMQDPITVLMLN